MMVNGICKCDVKVNFSMDVNLVTSHSLKSNAGWYPDEFFSKFVAKSDLMMVTLAPVLMIMRHGTLLTCPITKRILSPPEGLICVGAHGNSAPILLFFQ